MTNLHSILYSCALLLPLLALLLDDSLILDHSSFLFVALLIILAYLTLNFPLQQAQLDHLRKFMACLTTASLTIIVSSYLGDTLIAIYNIDFGEQIVFLIKIVLIICNMEGTLDLIDELEQY